MWRCFALSVCSGNLWLLDWAFAGVLLAFLKFRLGVFLVRSAVLGITGSGLRAQRILRLYSYVLHKSTDQLTHFMLRWAVLHRPYWDLWVTRVLFGVDAWTKQPGSACSSEWSINIPLDFHC
jgi:hypothetical protein